MTGEGFWHRFQTAIRGYAIAVLFVSIAAVVSKPLRELLPGLPGSIFFCAVILSAWKGGWGPGLLASVLSSVAYVLWVGPLLESAAPTWWNQLPQFLLLFCASLFISWLCSKQKKVEVSLRQAREELELRVQERTAELTTTNAELKTEIAERKRAEGLLFETKSRLELILENSPLAIAGLNPEGRIASWNKAAERLFGWTAPEVIGEFCKTVPPEGKQEYLQAIEKVMLGETIIGMVTDRHKKNGGRLTCSVSFAPQRNEHGELIGISAIIEDITKRRQAEEALRRSERELRLAIDTIPVMAWTLRADGVVDFLNQRWMDYSGVSLEQYVADPKGPIHPEDAPRIFEKWRAQMEVGQAYDDEMRLRSANGEYRWFLVRTAPLFDEQGKIVKWFGVSVDIEDRKRAERVLFETKSKLELILENSPLAIAGLNPEGQIASWNRAAERLFGWTADEAIGQFCKTVPPEGRQEYLRVIRRVIAGGTVLGLVTYRRNKSGDLLTCSVSFAPQRNEHGEVIGITAIIEDITERRQAEHAVQQSQQLLESVLATLPVGVIVTNKEGDIILSNAASRAIWSQLIISGRERREKTRAFWHETGKQIEPAEWTSMRALNGQTILNDLVDIEIFNRERKTIRNSAAPIRNPDGQIAGAVIVNEDVTEAEKSEEKLRQAQAELAHVARVTMMGELTASIAHEVNQPLAAVVTNANAAFRWLDAKPPNLEEAREAVQRIARDGTRASEVILRIRAILKKSEPSRTPVNLNELIEETLILTQPELKQKKISLQVELSPHLPPVQADRVQLQQVLLNLLVNAVESLSAVAGRSRRLRVRTAQTDPLWVQVLVEDTGAGIKADQVERLFEPFHTTKEHGIGLGLSISRSIVDAHGGRLWAAPNDGHGATFQFSLPIQNGGES